MAKGPAGGPRPLVTTNLKYDVILTMPHEVFIDEDLKAADVVDVRVNAPLQSFASWIKQRIGKVILASNKLAHPSRIRTFDEELEVHSPGMTRPPVHTEPGEIEIKWTYIIRGAGIGKFANTSTTSDRVVSLHKVLIDGDDSPIKRSSVVREFDSGPATIHSIRIGTE